MDELVLTANVLTLDKLDVASSIPVSDASEAYAGE